MASSPLSRTISGTYRELDEKKGIVIGNLEHLHEEEKKKKAKEEEKKASGGESAEEEEEEDARRKRKGLESAEALKIFFDRIPLSSIPGINNETVLEVNAGACIGDAIKQLYKEGTMGAPVCDDTIREGDPYIGLLDFSTMVLWALEELEKAEEVARARGLTGYGKDTRFDKEEEHAMGSSEGFFKFLQQHPSVMQTKVASMARCFRWGPFLPVSLEDTLLHALLMLSKHSLKAVPVLNPRKPKVVGFVTQDAAVKLLLQCAGLEWFDAIADKKLSEFKFEIDQTVREILHVKADEAIFDAMMCMWKHRKNGVPVIDADSSKIVGHIRSTDVRLLLDYPGVFERRRDISVAEFMKLDVNEKGNMPADDVDDGVVVSAGSLRLKTGGRTKMLDVVTCEREETLKSVMLKLMKARGERSFLVDQELHILGIITLRDIIIQFAPPLTEFVTAFPGFFQA